MSSSENHEYFHEIASSCFCEEKDELKILLEKYYSLDWFLRNDSKFSMLKNSVIGQPPLSLADNCYDKQSEIIKRYIDSLKNIHIHVQLNDKVFKRLINSHTSFQTYFELRILTLLAESGFDVETDFKTSRGRDVEAKICNGQEELLIECKTLGLSDQSINFYNWYNKYKLFLTQKHMDKVASVTGEIEFLNHFNEKKWHAIFDATNKAIDQGCLYEYEDAELKFIISPNPSPQYPNLMLSERLPENDRIKTPLKKTINKLKGFDGAVLFCCVPMEAGQKSAYDEAQKLLENSKYKKIKQILIVDPLNTFETEFIKIWSIPNPNYEGNVLIWDENAKIFKTSKQTI